jgi:hypothetical protein
VKHILKIIKRLVNGLTSKHLRRRVTNESEAVDSYGDAWQSIAVPAKQWGLVSTQLEKLAQGELTPEFSTFLRVVALGVERIEKNPTDLLEIGCSSGYYGRVLHSRFPGISYTGVDFSSTFVDFGKTQFPDLKILVGDTTNLNFRDSHFDLVVSGCVLLHVYDWKMGLKETCRVASRFVILHRTPVSNQPTTLFTKSAYGEKMIEWTFNENEIVSETISHGFSFKSVHPIHDGDLLDDNVATPKQFTYLFERL